MTSVLHFDDDAHEGLLVHGQQGERFAESSVTSAPISLNTPMGSEIM